MRLKELMDIIDSQGLRVGVNSVDESLVIMTTGYRKIGEIGYSKPLDVVLDLDLHTEPISEENKMIIYDAILEFTLTPIERRSLKGEERLFVVEITNTDDVSDKVWYKKKSGALVVARFDEDFETFATYNQLGEWDSYGLIPQNHCKVISSFEYEGGL